MMCCKIEQSSLISFRHCTRGNKFPCLSVSMYIFLFATPGATGYVGCPAQQQEQVPSTPPSADDIWVVLTFNCSCCQWDCDAMHRYVAQRILPTCNAEAQEKEYVFRGNLRCPSRQPPPPRRPRNKREKCSSCALLQDIPRLECIAIIRRCTQFDQA